MKCHGDWNDPDKRKSFSTAVWSILKAHKQTGTYVPSCDDCCLMPEEEWFKGCDSHKGRPSILQSGNPTYNNIFTDSMDKIHLDCKEYRRQPTEQLLPCYVWQIRDRLLSSNSMIDLQTFVIIMVSICLFLQFDDFLDIELSHFEQKLFVFDSCGNIKALCLRTYGKSDAGWTHLFLRTDEECQEIYPVSILLCFVHCAGIKGGFIFPSEQELKSPPDNGIFVTQLSYSVVMSRMNKIAKQVLGLVNYKVRMHTFCCTGYLCGR